MYVVYYGVYTPLFGLNIAFLPVCSTLHLRVDICASLTHAPPSFSFPISLTHSLTVSHSLSFSVSIQLDLEACVWLEDYLSKWERTLVIVSHSQDFINNVCTNVILLRNQKLQYFTGMYVFMRIYMYVCVYVVCTYLCVCVRACVRVQF